MFYCGFTRNWSTEIFKTAWFFFKNPPIYHLKESKNELIEVRFYEQKLIKTMFPRDTYLIDKVLRRKHDKVYVK